MELTRIEQLIDLPFVLVSGQARSGTTVLTQAMAAHPDVFSNGMENTWMRDVLDLLAANVDNQSRMRQCLVSPEQFVASFREATFKILFPDKVWPAKLPQAVSTFSSLKHEVFEQLTQLLPRVKLLNIVRNGVEVVSSRMIHRHIGAWSFEDHCEAWARSVDVVEWAEGQPYFMLVRHEQLLGDGTGELFRAIQAWIGLDYSDRCHEFVLQNLINTTGQSDEPITQPGHLKNRIDRCRNWTAEQKGIFEEVCSDGMAYFGYRIPWLG